MLKQVECILAYLCLYYSVLTVINLKDAHQTTTTSSTGTVQAFTPQTRQPEISIMQNCGFGCFGLQWVSHMDPNRLCQFRPYITPCLPCLAYPSMFRILLRILTFCTSHSLRCTVCFYSESMICFHKQGQRLIEAINMTTTSQNVKHNPKSYNYFILSEPFHVPANEALGKILWMIFYNKSSIYLQ